LNTTNSDARVKPIIKLLKSKQAKDSLKKQLRNKDSILHHYYMQNLPIDNEKSLFFEYYNMEFCGFKAPTIETIDFGNIVYIGNDEYSIELSAKGKGEFLFTMSYGYYHDEVENEPDYILNSMTGDGICEVKATLKSTVVGYLKLLIHHSLTTNSIKNLFDTCENLEDEFSIDIELEHAVLD